MKRIKNSTFLAAGLTVGALAITSTAHADLVTIDFSTEDDGVTPLVNGQQVGSPGNFGNLFHLSSAGPNAGAAIFDSTMGGPNAGGGDPDLLVGLGNILILQNDQFSDQTANGIFDSPNDDQDGGLVTFNFLQPVTMHSIDLVDFDAGNGGTITLLDGGGLTRNFAIAPNFTNDIDANGPNGWDTLDLTTLGLQMGEGGGMAAGVDDNGFNPNNVVQMSVSLMGSGGLDNVTFDVVPGPSALAALALAGFCRSRRRRTGC